MVVLGKMETAPSVWLGVAVVAIVPDTAGRLFALDAASAIETATLVSVY